MSANIERNKQKGTDSFMSRKEIPWHGLGTIVDTAQSTADAIRLCNADFEVGLAEIYAKYPKELWKNDAAGNPLKGAKVPGSFATYRKDNLHIFGLVGARYEVIQNIEAFEFIDGIVETGEAVIETAGVLGDGEKIFVTAKLPDYITLSNGDDIQGYLFITTSHDGSGMVTAAISRIRIVCNNTLDAALHNCTNKISFKHTKNVRDKLEQGKKLMQLNNKFSKEFSDALFYLKGNPVNDEQVLEVIYKLVLTDNEVALVNKANGSIARVAEISTRKKNSIFDLGSSIDSGPGQDLYRGSALWLYNGVTTYLSNTKTYSDGEDRLLSLTEGTESKLRQTAFNLITTL